MLDKLLFKAHKKFGGSVGLVEFFLTAMLRLIACNMGDKWFGFEGTLFHSEGIQLRPVRLSWHSKCYLIYETDREN